MLTCDSNVLIYACDLADPRRQPLASNLLARMTAVSCFLTQQAIGEFCNVVYRKRLMTANDIRLQVEDWVQLIAVVPTRPEQLLAAADLAERRQKQFWDMVIVRVAADAGATTLLTEDIGDGETVAGVRIVNPFDPANDTAVAALLTPAS